MLLVFVLAGILVPLLITPGLLFHFDTTPKVIALAFAAAIALVRFRKGPNEIAGLWARRWGKWLVIASAVQVAWMAITTATSPRPWFSFYGSGWRRFGLVETASLLIVSVAVTAGLSERRDNLRLLLRICVGAGCVAAVYGICQYFGIDPLQPVAAYQAHAGDSIIVRPPGTMGHADYFAWWLAIDFFCCIAAASIEKEFWKHAAGFSAATIAAAILLSGTRGAILAIFAGVVAMAFLYPSPIRIRRKHMVAVSGALVLLTAFIFSNAGTLLRARAVWSGDEPIGGARPLLWRDSLHMAAAKPIFGFGPDTFLTEFARYQSEDLSRLLPDFHHESPHNLPMDALTSMGVPGLLLLAGWVLFGALMVDQSRRAGSKLAAPLGAALIASTAASMFNAASLAPVLLTLLVAGMLVADSKPEADGTSLSVKSGLRWPLRIGAGIAALAIAAFGATMTMEDARLQDFSKQPDEAHYLALERVSLPGAGEDLYASRVLQQVCAKRSNLTSYLLCRQQTMRASSKALKSSDDLANAWYSLSMLSAAQNEPVWTRRSLEEAIQVSPNWFKPHWALARFLWQTGSRELAASEATRAAFLDSNRDPEVVETASQLTARK